MAKNFLKHGDEFDYIAGSNIKSGDVVLMSDIVGIAQTDILSGNTGTVQVAGVANITKNTGEAWNQGDKIYWDNTNKWFTSTATGNTWAGWAYYAALSADAVGYVKLKIS